MAKKDFTPLAKKYGVDKLVVVEIQTLGLWRTYSAYCPTSDPKAVFGGVAHVNLRTTHTSWYAPGLGVQERGGRVGSNQPNFPELTNAYFQAMEVGKDEFVKPLLK